MSSPSNVLEIGGAQGILSRIYHCNHPNTSWTIVEPNPIPCKGVKAKFINSFFDDNFVSDEQYDTIVHSHVLEHVYDPLPFLSSIGNFLQTGQHLVFTLPNMRSMLERKYTNCINFEHTLFLAEEHIEWMLSKVLFESCKNSIFLKIIVYFIVAIMNKISNLYLLHLTYMPKINNYSAII